MEDGDEHPQPAQRSERAAGAAGGSVVRVTAARMRPCNPLRMRRAT